MRLVVLIVLGVLLGCSGTGSARYRHSTPPVLPAVGPPLPPSRVPLSFAPFTWQQTVATPHEFRVHVATPGGNWLRGGQRAVGDVRSPDLATGADGRLALYCGWSLGQEDGCIDPDAPALGRRLVLEALGSLRQQAAGAGAVELRQVRCFVRGVGRVGGVLWCEGVALSGEPVAPGFDQPEPVVEARAEAAPSRWRIAATASVGSYGGTAVSGTTLGISYRAIELGFHMVSTYHQRSIGLGADLLGRWPIGRGLHLIAGGTVGMLSPLSAGGEAATDRRSRGAIGPVLGIGYQPDLDLRLFGGFGKPFAELRIGWLAARRRSDGSGADLAGGNLELLIGLRTP